MGKLPHEKLPPSKNTGSRSDLIRGLSQLSQLGIGIAVCVLIGVFIGRFLDSTFGTSPWMLLLFSLFGAGAAFRFLIDFSKRM